MSLTLPPRSPRTTGVDPLRWPDVATIPPGGIRERIARRLFLRLARRLDLQILLPDGRNVGAGRAGRPVMRLNRPTDFYRRVGYSGLIGFGEAYLAGDWTAEDLTGVLTVFCERMATLVPPSLQRLRDLAVHRHPQGEDGSAENAKTNISRHYDLSNDLFALFLDTTMTYSSALFAEPFAANRSGLAEAQQRKIDRLLDVADVRAGSRVLEVGTGWGELAIRAAARGATVRSVTLSEEQQALARARIDEAGFADRVTVDLCDYRAVTGRYDAVVSVEMIEAVGHDFWPEYFRALDRVLVPGGRVGLQAITMPHDRMLASRHTYTWIHKYVFPGGLIPSVRSIEDTVREHTDLRVADRYAFGRHYAETLRLWREDFTSRAGEVEALGFDGVFQAMWTFYLAYSEAGFRAGYLDVHQFALSKLSAPGASAGPAA